MQTSFDEYNPTGKHVETASVKDGYSLKTDIENAHNELNRMKVKKEKVGVK